MNGIRTQRLFRQIITVCIVFLLMLPIISASFGEQATWDCPKCGRTDNAGNFCGECGTPRPSVSPADFVTIELNKGDFVQFGHYPQTSSGNDNSPIKWQVLDVQGGKALLLSKYGLDAKPYHREAVGITWEECTLRGWLNGDFLNKAFTVEEQNAILLTKVDNSKGQGYLSTYGGNNTRDKIFLLSYAEANKYLGVNESFNIKSRMAPTAYAKKQGAFTSSKYKTADGEPAGWWWLRSPGNFQSDAAYVNFFGSRSNYGVNSPRGVRPALWLKLIQAN